LTPSFFFLFPLALIGSPPRGLFAVQDYVFCPSSLLKGFHLCLAVAIFLSHVPLFSCTPFPCIFESLGRPFFQGPLRTGTPGQTPLFLFTFHSPFSNYFPPNRPQKRRSSLPEPSAEKNGRIISAPSATFPPFSWLILCAGCGGGSCLLPPVCNRAHLRPRGGIPLIPGLVPSLMLRNAASSLPL